MGAGLSFLKTVLTEKSTKSFLSDFGLKMDYFPEDERKVAQYILQFISRYDKLPSPKTVERETEIEFPKAGKESLKYWADAVRRDYLGNLIVGAIRKASTHLEAGQEIKALEALEWLSTKTLEQKLRSGAMSGVDLGEAVIAQHDARQRRASTVELTYGFPFLDDITDGCQPGDTTAIAGPTGVGKTYLLCKMLTALHLSGKVPLLVSMEMSAEQAMRRVLALRTGVTETKIRKGQLNTLGGRKKLIHSVEIMKGEAPMWMITGALAYRLEDLVTHIRNLNPDVVYIDGGYLMKSAAKASRYERIAEVTEQVKMVASVTNTPIISTYNLGDKDEIYGGKAIKFQASIVLHVAPDNEDNTPGHRLLGTGVDTKLVLVKKGRSGESGRMRIMYDMRRMRIEQLEVLRGSRSSDRT